MQKSQEAKSSAWENTGSTFFRFWEGNTDKLLHIFSSVKRAKSIFLLFSASVIVGVSIMVLEKLQEKQNEMIGVRNFT